MLRLANPAGSNERSQLFPLGQNRAVLIVQAKSFLEIPESVIIGAFEPTILNWAYYQTSIGARLLFLVEKEKEDGEWPREFEQVLIEPGLIESEVASLDLSDLSPPSVIPVLLNFMLTASHFSYGDPDWRASINALLQRLDIHSLATASVRGWHVAADETTIVFRTLVEQNSFPTGFLISSAKGLQFAYPLDMKLSEPDLHGICFAELRVRVFGGDPQELLSAATLHMLSGKRLTRVNFVMQ